MAYPPTRREEVVEILHGVAITDQYRWLEDADSAEVAAWSDAQNEYTSSALAAVPGREHLRARLSELLAIGVVSAPKVRGARHFYTRRSATQNQPVLVLRDGLHGAESVLLDPNGEADRPTVALDWWYPSPDGRLIAFGYSDHGDEWSTLQVLDVESGELRPDSIPFTRFCSLAWEPDNGGFYYTRYPAPGSVPPGEENYHRHVFHHRLGSDPASDPLIYGAGRALTDSPMVDISADGRYLLVVVGQGWTRTDVFLAELGASAPVFRPVITGEDALFYGELAGDKLYLITNWQAPRYRIVAVDPANPTPEHWREIIAARPDTTIEAMALIAGGIVLNGLRDVTSHAELYSLDGAPQGEIALPALSSITGLGGEFDGDHIFVDYESYTVPPTVISYSPAEGAATWASVELPVDLSNLVVEQVWYSSRDGTRVPMVVIHQAGIALDGSTPAVLTGYGGFNLSKVPAFTRNALPWLELGGVFAVANMRGGAEFGEEWHRAGMRGNKQNVFDDFAAAAEYLIAQGYTSRDRLGIWGRSNGGLLVGAALVQRPDLFKAVVCQVPLLDMLRYQGFRIARLWIDEYGTAEDPADFQWLHAYSPYHNVTPAADYPALYLTTATSDSRVDPMHARKMAALLQTVSANPVLLSVEKEAGHGQGKPLARYVDEQLDVWAFFVWQLGMTVPD